MKDNTLCFFVFPNYIIRNDTWCSILTYHICIWVFQDSINNRRKEETLAENKQPEYWMKTTTMWKNLKDILDNVSKLRRINIENLKQIKYPYLNNYIIVPPSNQTSNND